MNSQGESPLLALQENSWEDGISNTARFGGIFDPKLEENVELVRQRITALSQEPIQMVQGPCVTEESVSLVNTMVKDKLIQSWKRMKKSDTEENLVELSVHQKIYETALFSHQDVYDVCASWKQRHERQELYCLHILNQLLLQRQRIIKNNERLVTTPELELRDQGFTRPRVLIIVPFRSSALEIIRIFSKLWSGLGGQVDNQGRLEEEFGPSEEDQAADDRRKSSNQPADFVDTFKGNSDDCFRIGIKCTRKSLKCFCDFYSSDIIVASPLGLRFITDGQSETKKIKINNARSKKKRIVKKGDADFLSSIQMLIVEQAEVIAMQNWEHVPHVLEYVNKLPKQSHGCDFSRVQTIFLDGIASSARQNLIFSAYPFPELNHLFASPVLANCAGKWCRSGEGTYPGVIKSATRHLSPRFHLIGDATLANLPTRRLNYFVENILASLSQSAHHVCIFISSYLDFVQVREHFTRHDISHAVLSEYCDGSHISAARTRFFNGEARFLLVSERFHFFKRYRIRGISRLIFYSLPEQMDFFEEWCSMVDPKEVKSPTATELPMIVSPFDYLKAARIVGSKRVKSLFGGE